MNTLIKPPPVPYPTRYIIDPVAFFVALIGGPILFTVASFWAFLIPLYALVLGGPLYLIIGTPVLLWYLRRHDGNPSDVAVLAFKVIMAGLIVVGIALALASDQDLLWIALGFAGFGLIFGPAWAYFFGWIYRARRRDFFAKPRPI